MLIKEIPSILQLSLKRHFASNEELDKQTFQKKTGSFEMLYPTWIERLVAVFGDREVPNSSGRGMELVKSLNYKSVL